MKDEDLRHHKSPGRKGSFSQDRLDKIYEELRNRICVLIYKPGTVLREHDLAQSFGVSRTPIRQVLQRLQFEGLVAAKKGVGTIVTGFNLDSLKNAYEVRLKVTEWVGELSQRRYGPADTEEMGTLLQRAQALRHNRDPQEYWNICNALHEILGRVIVNNTLRSLYDLLYYQTARSWFQLVTEIWEKNVDLMCSEIADELKSMQIGDIRGVLLARRNHIMLFLSLVDSYLDGASEGLLSVEISSANLALRMN